jgi:hypothetical protein
VTNQVKHSVLLGGEFDKDPKDVKQVEQLYDHYIIPAADWHGIQLRWVPACRFAGSIPEPMADDSHAGYLIVPDRKRDRSYLPVPNVKRLTVCLISRGQSNGVMLFLRLSRSDA